MVDRGVDQTIGGRVRAVLKDRGWSTAMLSDESGLSRNGLTNKLLGRRGWSARELVLVAETFGMQPGEFFEPVAAPASLPGVLKLYLEGTGWVVRSRFEGGWLLDPPGGSVGWSPLLVPFDPEYADYALRLGEALRVVTRWEARKPGPLGPG